MGKGGKITRLFTECLPYPRVDLSGFMAPIMGVCIPLAVHLLATVGI
jgi:hypothetical protein